MEKSHLSNSQKNIQDMNKNIFIHVYQPKFIPVDSLPVAADSINELQNNYFEKIFINDLLDYLDYSDATNILNTIKEKLTSNGELIIQSVDLYHLANAISFADIDLDTAKLILYQNKKHIYTLYEIQLELRNRDFTIQEQKFLNMFEYYVRASKNDN